MPLPHFTPMRRPLPIQTSGTWLATLRVIAGILLLYVLLYFAPSLERTWQFVDPRADWLFFYLHVVVRLSILAAALFALFAPARARRPLMWTVGIECLLYMVDVVGVLVSFIQTIAPWFARPALWVDSGSTQAFRGGILTILALATLPALAWVLLRWMPPAPAASTALRTLPSAERVPDVGAPLPVLSYENPGPSGWERIVRAGAIAILVPSGASLLETLIFIRQWGGIPNSPIWFDPTFLASSMKVLIYAVAALVCTLRPQRWYRTLAIALIVGSTISVGIVVLNLSILARQTQSPFTLFGLYVAARSLLGALLLPALVWWLLTRPEARRMGQAQPTAAAPVA